MFATNGTSKWITLSLTLAVATVSVFIWRRKSKVYEKRVRELELALKSSVNNCAAERQGRIRSQQALRKTLSQQKSDSFDSTCYPVTPIGIIQSCFSTRNGTPRQPLLVPLARARLNFNQARVPPACLEGLEEYSHCWIIYVFHMNTNLEKLWKNPSHSKFKAKVRVPKLKGGKMGVFATRSPHRPCPIGLTVAKVEEVQGNAVLFSGVDLVDGTPVLDIKPYLPYCDSNQEATVPSWVNEDKLLSVASINFSDGFAASLSDCWIKQEKKSLYKSADEFKSLIRQVLSWDIRSLSQRIRYHGSVTRENGGTIDNCSDLDENQDEAASDYHETEQHDSLPSSVTVYHLILEGLDVSYTIDSKDNVIVEKLTRPSLVSDILLKPTNLNEDI
ncbi:uncharacterized protein LOC124914625 [Impatiens glandulifera]|uniref:uncharacterized protein LOC124914625 n=1 Tax=Impatiens glandulifera TaxID=253017 RepID=UPI001FB14758|nr:uncharacterized protein LOC124914625 [Impatiens glandulifera]